MTKLLRRHLEHFTCSPSASKFFLRDVHKMRQFQYTIRYDNFMFRHFSLDRVLHRHNKQRERHLDWNNHQIYLVLISSSNRALNCPWIGIEKHIYIFCLVLGSPLNDRDKSLILSSPRLPKNNSILMMTLKLLTYSYTASVLKPI